MIQALDFVAFEVFWERTRGGVCGRMVWQVEAGRGQRSAQGGPPPSSNNRRLSGLRLDAGRQRVQRPQMSVVTRSPQKLLLDVSFHTVP